MSEPLRILVLNSCRVDLVHREVHREGTATRLSANEAHLLHWLATHPGDVFSRDELLVEVWNYRDGVKSRTVDTTVQRLRQKIESDPANPAHIHSVRGVGYYFEGSNDKSHTDIPLPPAHRGNLDETTSPFCGREQDLIVVENQLQKHRLLTITGTGGVGKSALAHHFGLSRTQRGVWKTDWSTARESLDILQCCATDFRVPLASMPSEEEAFNYIGRTLASRGCRLVIIDSPEAVLEQAHPVIAMWMEHCPDAKFLCTSRIPLGLNAESVVQLQPVDPEAGAALFEAHLAKRTVRTPDSQQVISRIVASLDGLPLAIELAAKRSRVLSLAQIEARLDERLQLLDGPRQRASNRNQSMRASLHWSWELLSGWERSALSQLAVLGPCFDLQTADAIVKPQCMESSGQIIADRGPAPPLVDIIDELAHASILRVLPRVDNPFELPRVFRDFIIEISVLPEDVYERVHQYYLSMARQWDVQTNEQGQQMAEHAATFVRIHRETYRRAPEISAQAILSIASYLRQSMPRAASIRLLEAAKRCADRCESPPLTIAANRELGLALLSQGRTTQAETLFDQALALATTENSAIDMARIYLSKSTTCRIARKVEEAASWCDKADILRQKNLLQSTADRPDWKLLSLDVEWIRSVQALHRVDRIGAEEHLKAMYQTAEELGWPRRGIRVFLALGTLCEMSGRFLEAGEYYRRSIQSLDDFDDTVGCAWAKINYTGLLLNSGRLEQAQTLAAEVIDIEEQLGRGTNLAFAQQLLGCVYLEQAKFSEATELLLRARDAHRSSTRRRAEADTLGDIARLCYTTGHLDEALSHLDQGLAMVDGDDVDRWQLLVTQAMVRARLGLVSEAHESLAALEAFQDRLPTRGKICLQLARASCVWAEARADDKTDSDSCKQNYQAALSLIDELRNSAAVHTSTVARCGLRLLTEKVSSHTRRSE